MNTSVDQIYLVPQFEGDHVLKTAAVTPGNPNQIGETHIVCRFTKRLPNFMLTPPPAPLQKGCQTSSQSQTAAVNKPFKKRINYWDSYHSHWYFSRVFLLLLFHH